MKKMKSSISVYLNKSLNFSDVELFISTASQYGFDEVFTSLHLPELSLEEQINNIGRLTKYAHMNSMSVVADVDGNTLDEIFSDVTLTNALRKAEIDGIRLDCYYSGLQVNQAIKDFALKLIVINASILNIYEVNKFIQSIKSEHREIQIAACHNFYPRKETGLSIEYFQNQNKIFKELGIEITACLPSYENPRGPLYDGLPTLEDHRIKSLEAAALELNYEYQVDRILMGDPFISKKEMEIIFGVIEGKPINLYINLMNDLDDQTKLILFGGTHYVRRDNGDYLLRLESSRKMALPGERIKPFNTTIRNKYCVTIDNENYGRYSGEIQIPCKKLQEDSRVNVIAQVDDNDVWKLKLIEKGCNFTFKVKL